LDQYYKKVHQLKFRQKEIDLRLRFHTEADQDFGMTLSLIIGLCSQAHELFLSSKVDQIKTKPEFIILELSFERWNR
jgi:hypothetical protein